MIFYRDGAGGPTLAEKCSRLEIPSVTSIFEEYESTYKPRVIYCLIDKLSGTRLFSKDRDSVVNPGPGTLIDSAIVESEGDRMFDFFLIPHKATIATANPVHYKVVYNTSDFTKKDI